jgi:hypothetical protein
MVNLFINDFKKGKIIVKNSSLAIVSESATDKGQTKKPLSESKVLKRTYTSKKEVNAACVTLQERSAEDDNRPRRAEKNRLRCDTYRKR